MMHRKEEIREKNHLKKSEDGEMLDEYDFSRGVRGKYVNRFKDKDCRIVKKTSKKEYLNRQI